MVISDKRDAEKKKYEESICKTVTLFHLMIQWRYTAGIKIYLSLVLHVTMKNAPTLMADAKTCLSFTEYFGPNPDTFYCGGGHRETDIPAKTAQYQMRHEDVRGIKRSYMANHSITILQLKRNL